MKFQEEIKKLKGLDLLILKNKKEAELKEVELEILRRVKDEK